MLGSNPEIVVVSVLPIVAMLMEPLPISGSLDAYRLSNASSLILRYDGAVSITVSGMPLSIEAFTATTCTLPYVPPVTVTSMVVLPVLDNSTPSELTTLAFFATAILLICTAPVCTAAAFRVFASAP